MCTRVCVCAFIAGMNTPLAYISPSPCRSALVYGRAARSAGDVPLLHQDPAQVPPLGSGGPHPPSAQGAVPRHRTTARLQDGRQPEEIRTQILPKFMETRGFLYRCRPELSSSSPEVSLSSPEVSSWSPEVSSSSPEVSSSSPEVSSSSPEVSSS